MIVSRYIAAGAAATAMLVALGCRPNNPPSPTQPAPSPTADAAVTSWVTVQGDVWIPAIDALGGHLVAASAAYQASSTAQVGAELAGAAALLQERASEASEEDRPQLEAAAAELQAASEALERGEPMTADRVDELLDAAWEANVSSVWAVADPTAWAPFVREPERLLELALARFEDGDPSGTSGLLRQAAAIVRIEAARGETVADQEELVGVRMDLREAASEVEGAEIQDVSRLETVAARAAHALARHHQLEAEHEFQVDSPATAAAALDTAVAYLERAYEWSGTPIEPKTEAVLAKARAAAEDSEVEGQPAVQDLEPELIAVGAEIDHLAAIVEPAWLRVATS